MDGTNLILTQPVSPPLSLEHLPKSNIENASDEKKRQIARDFESVLLTRLMEQMKETVGDWGFEKDGSSSQVQGIFWLYLAQEVANSGGLGLWKDICQFMTGDNPTSAAEKSSI